MTIEERLNIIAENVPKVYANGVEDGKIAERKAFWGGFQNNGNPTSYSYAFRTARWTDSIYNPEHDIVLSNAGDLGNAFNGSVITDTKKPIIFLSGGNASNAFYNATAMKTIRPITVVEGVVFGDTCFYRCVSLENISFNGTLDSSINLQWSTKLNRNSIMSVINALSTTTSGLTVTLSKTAVNKAFETTEGANDGSTSAEWLALVGTKSNWTIALA